MMKRGMMVAVVLGLAAVAAMGAGIVWDTDANGDSPYWITGESDVRTDGVLVYAHGGNVTVNQVSFRAFSSANAAGTDIEMPFGGGPYNDFGAPGIPPPYATLITSGVYKDTSAAIEITLNNLTAGASYQIQFWVTDSRNYGASRHETLSSAGGNTVTLKFQNAEPGALLNGQYAVGYFVADGATQDFQVTPNASAQMNAIQVRQLPAGDLFIVKADPPLVNAALMPWDQFVEKGKTAGCEVKANLGYTITAVYTNGVLLASPGDDIFAFALEDVQENIFVSADVARDFSVPLSYTGNSGNWSDAGKWASGLVATNGETARFVTQANQTISVDVPVLLGGLYMTQQQTFNAAGGDLTFADGAEIRAYHGNNTTTFNLPLKGTGGTITKRGSGGVSNNALNMRFAGLFEDFATVNLMGGWLESTAAGTVAISTGNVTLAGSRLTVAPSADTAAQTIAGGGTFTVGPGPNLITMTKHSTSTSFSLTLGGALAHLPGGVLPINRTGWDGTDTKIFLAQPPALVNGILPPWIVSANGVGERNHFVTYDATDGIVDVTTVDHSLAGAMDIAEVSANVSLADGTAFHALEVNNATVTLNGTLTLGDGTNPTGIALNQGTIQNNTIDIGASDLYIWSRNADGSNLKSVITGSGSVSFCSGLHPNWGTCQNLPFNPSSPCTYTGPTHISGTRVQVTTGHSPFGPGDIYIYGNESRIGGQMFIAGGCTIPNNLHISGFGADQDAAIRVAANATLLGTIEVMDYAAIQTYIDPLLLGNLIYGPGKLRFRNPHDGIGRSVTLTYPNTYAGGTEILSTTLQLDHIQGASTGPIELLNTNSRLRFNNAEDWVFTNRILGVGSLAKINTGRLTITDFRGQSTTMNELVIADGDVALPNVPWGFQNTAMNPASTLTILPGPPRTFTVSGNSSAANSLCNLSGPVSLIKNFGNTLTLGGTNTYSGATAIEGGTLQVLCADTFPAATALTFDNFATLDLNGFSQTVARFSGKGRVISAAPATLIFGDAQDTTFEGYIDGDLTLAKQGPGTATFAVSGTYTGDTLISGGTLRLSAFDRALPPPAIAPVALWLDASNTDSLDAAHDDPVSLWQDLSENGYAFETSTTLACAQPVVDGAKQNGLNMVRFSRTQQTRLEAWDCAPVPNIHSLAAVLIMTDADGGGGGNQGIFGRAAWGADHGIRKWNSGYAFEAPNGFYDNGGCFVNGTQTTAFIDKEPMLLVTMRNGDNNLADMALGSFYAADRAFSGWIGEVIGFSTVLSTSQRQQAEGYLRAKWFGTDPVPAASSNLLPTATSVILSNGATLDLGGTEQTVAELIGEGLVTNGTLTVTGRLAINANPDGSYDALAIAATLIAEQGAVIEITNPHLLSTGRIVIPCENLEGAFARVIPGRFSYTYANGEITLSNRATMILLK
ncbi:MAG: autotransporter-associated beta strand repeat-containing protein [Kiritimatiellaeota bacterium]|nr:autotransporter-associated beta strand repeat-containing protein [Kiritimatiellota bacterium]